MQISTSCGSSETLVNELTVIPRGMLSVPQTVVTVTPVGNLLHATRK
jgi:hypothetical protein